MNVPESDDLEAVGVSAMLARFSPQTTMVWVLPAVAVLFGAGHAAPTVAEMADQATY